MTLIQVANRFISEYFSSMKLNSELSSSLFYYTYDGFYPILYHTKYRSFTIIPAIINLISDFLGVNGFVARKIIENYCYEQIKNYDTGIKY